MPGPVPNRPEDQSRERDANRSDRLPISQGILRPVERIPNPATDWPEMVQELYWSAADSGQSDFYQMSDWWLWWSLCEDLAYYKQMGRRSGQMLQVIYSTMTDLLVTEGSRRRARVILAEEETDTDEQATLLVLDSYRQDLGVANDSA